MAERPLGDIIRLAQTKANMCTKLAEPGLAVALFLSSSCIKVW